MKRKLLAIALVFALAISLAACSGGSNSANSGGGQTSEVSVGWINATMSDAFYKVLVETAQSEAEANGWKFSYVDSNMDSTAELAAFEDYITQGVDIIYVDCVDPVAVVAGIKKANDAGIPVIVVDNPVDNPEASGIEVVTQIMSDNVGLGCATGYWMGENFPIEQQVMALELSGQKGNQGNYKRRTGAWAGLMAARINAKEGTALKAEEMLERAYEMEDELIDTGKATDDRSGVSILMIEYGNFSEAGGLDATEKMLSAHPDANMIICESDPMLVGGMQTIDAQQLGDQVYCLAVANGTLASLEMIKSGKIDCVGENNPVKVAQMSIEQGKLLLGGQTEFEALMYTPPNVIDATNVDEYMKDAKL